jgi:hypothetical protein
MDTEANYIADDVIEHMFENRERRCGEGLTG